MFDVAFYKDKKVIITKHATSKHNEDGCDLKLEYKRFLNIYDFELNKLVEDKLISKVDTNKFLEQKVWRILDGKIYYFVIEEPDAKEINLTLQSYNIEGRNLDKEVLKQRYKPSDVVIKGITHSTD